MGKFAYRMLSDLWHYCSRLGIDRIIELESYFKKRPYYLVIDPELVMAEIMSGTSFKLNQLEQRVDQGKKKQDFLYM